MRLAPVLCRDQRNSAMNRTITARSTAIPATNKVTMGNFPSGLSVAAEIGSATSTGLVVSGVGRISGVVLASTGELVDSGTAGVAGGTTAGVGSAVGTGAGDDVSAR